MNQTQTATAGGPVLLASAENGVVRLVMNRPERLNALNGELASALDKAFERIARDPSVRVVLLTGAGRAFCAGGPRLPAPGADLARRHERRPAHGHPAAAGDRGGKRPGGRRRHEPGPGR